MSKSVPEKLLPVNLFLITLLFLLLLSPNPLQSLLPRLASYFNISIDEFIGYEPQILFSDEPTSGLDPKSAQNVRAMIRSPASEHGITVCLCTHQTPLCTGDLHALRSDGNRHVGKKEK